MPIDRGELEALIEALIEEARQRARRRRRRTGAAVLLVAAAGVAAFSGFGGIGAGGGTAATAHAPDAPGATAGTRSAMPLGALPAGAMYVPRSGIAFDPRLPNTVYIAATSWNRQGVSRGHVYKTIDGGQHWRATATTDAGWTRIDALTADPRQSGTLYAGTNVAVYKTVNGGRSWRPWNRGLFSPPGPKRPFGTPGAPNWNRGEGWVTALAVDPADGSIVYSGADAVRKSTDGGHSWRTVFLPDRDAYRVGVSVTALAIAPTDPEAVYAIVQSGTGRTTMYKSSDGGKTWHGAGGGAAAVVNKDGWGGGLAFDGQDPTTVYASIGRTFVQSADAGASWQPIANSLPDQVISALAVDPRRSGTAYAGLHGGGVYKTTDGGRTWNNVVPRLSIAALAIDPKRPTTIYAAGNDRAGAHPNRVRLLRSTDDGHTWSIAG